MEYIKPNTILRNFLEQTVPYFTNKFSDQSSVLAYRLLPETVEIDVDNASVAVGSTINIIGVKVSYNYNSYALEGRYGAYFIKFKRLGIDSQINADIGLTVSFGIGTLSYRSRHRIFQVEYIGGDTYITVILPSIGIVDEMFYKTTIGETPPVITLTTDYGNALSGLNGIKTVLGVVSLGGGGSTLTFARDKLFNFDIDEASILLDNAVVHSWIRVVHSIEEEFLNYSIAHYREAKQNVIRMSIENARSDDGTFILIQQNKKIGTVKMLHILNVDVMLYRNPPSEANDMQGADSGIVDSLCDFVYDDIHQINSAVTQCLMLFNKALIQQSYDSINQINIERWIPVAENDKTGSYLRSRIQGEVEIDIQTFDDNILKGHTLIKSVELILKNEMYAS